MIGIHDDIVFIIQECFDGPKTIMNVFPWFPSYLQQQQHIVHSIGSLHWTCAKSLMWRWKKKEECKSKPGNACEQTCKI